MVNSEEVNRGATVYNIGRIQEDRKAVASRKPPSNYMVNRSQNASKSFNGGKYISNLMQGGGASDYGS